MDFFESQESAKRNTGKLYFLFGLAILSLIVVTNFLIMFIFGFAASEMTSMAGTQQMRFDWNQFLIIGAAVAAVVFFGSLYKIKSLSGGGARIAEMLDGKLLLGGGANLKEQQVLNVVEEMAIASGIPVPPVYLLDEEGINAFAAGYSPADAVIGISIGAVNALSREQLQGVIAHEFSHILHGDMRINIRLIGVLHGILILGIVGRSLLYSRSRVRNSRSKGQGVQLAIGLGLIVIGYIGVFFGNLIKAAVSRQREYLADASAVQFTRNPEGIAGALMQIAQHSGRSYLTHPASSEISHTLFEENAPSFLSGVYATHPPLEKRIGAILPDWDGDFGLLKKAAQEQPNTDASFQNQAGAPQASAPLTQQEKMTAVLNSMGGMVAAERLVSKIGSPEAGHIAFAAQLIEEAKGPLVDAAREPSGARAALYFLLLHPQNESRQAQLKLIEEYSDVGVYHELLRLVEKVKPVDPVERLPISSIAIASLRQLSGDQYQLFKSNFEKLITLDNKVNLFEWALQKTVFQSLDVVFEGTKQAIGGRAELRDVLRPISILLSILCYSNELDKLSPSQAFTAGQKKLGLKVELIPKGTIGFESLNDALFELVKLKPLKKPALLKACAAVITADGKIAPIEVELLRAVAATIDCPMPPLIAPTN
jgi:Zn-dependent protease with chaperone function